MKRRLGLVVAVGAGSLALFLLTQRDPKAAARPNVLLVTIDTLRADHLGCYGSSTAQTPQLDALARRGVRFKTAIAQAPLTAVSHASILTGLWPFRHGVRDNGAFALPESVPTLAERFQQAGYQTAAFISGFPLDRRFGLARGFASYDDQLPHGNDPRRAPYVERNAGATTAAAQRWLASTTQPWFVWIHYFDPHAPYEAPPEFAARFPDRPYAAEIAYVDDRLGALLQAIETREAGHTVVLATADHGESLGEHGEATHGVFVYDSTLRVPFLVAGPGITRSLASEVVARGVDVAATLLEVAGLEPFGASDGRSLRPALEGGAMSDAPAYSESLFASLNFGWAPLQSWRTRQWKYVEAPTPELYSLDNDGLETQNVAAQRRDVAASLRRPLLAALEAKTPEASATRSTDTSERLRALGYLAGGAPRAPSLRDPKDGRELLERLERGLAEARANAPLAIKALSAVLAVEPGMPLARRYRAIAFQSAKRYTEALADLALLERETTPNLEDLVLRGETERLAGRREQALATLDRANRLAPDAPEPLLFRGRVLRALGRTPEAVTAFQSALALDPDNAEAHRGLAEMALESGDVVGAAASYEALLAADPEDVGALVRLGVARVRAGRVPEALALFESAVVRDPRNAEALVDLAGALAKSGQAARAVPYFERAIAAGGESALALNGLGFARLEAGDGAGGLAALRRSLALDPRQPQVADVVQQISGARR